jgi:hypothetical protein
VVDGISAAACKQLSAHIRSSAALRSGSAIISAGLTRSTQIEGTAFRSPLCMHCYMLCSAATVLVVVNSRFDTLTSSLFAPRQICLGTVAHLQFLRSAMGVVYVFSVHISCPSLMRSQAIRIVLAQRAWHPPSSLRSLPDSSKCMLSYNSSEEG